MMMMCRGNSMKGLYLAMIAGVLFSMSFAQAAGMDSYLMYLGTYTGGASKGIYAYRFHPSTGEITLIGLAAESLNPSFLAIHPNCRFLYAVNETSNFEGGSGSISAFSIDDDTGRLKLINKVFSKGSNPCHLTIDKRGKWLLAANYSSESVSVFPIEEDGRLGIASTVIQHSGSGKDPSRQEGPHAHSVTLSPDNRFLLVSDLGLDKVMVYRFDAVHGTLIANDPSYIGVTPGAGPRHSSFHPNGRFVYQINELNSTLTAFGYDADRGSLRELETISTLPLGFSGTNITAEVQAHPDGAYVYGSNRGHDSIVVYAVRGEKGILEPVEYVSTRGRTPRHFAIDPSGSFLFAANQDSGEIVMFRISSETGKLSDTGTMLKIPNPVCIVFKSRF
jgi:6-phosphogluconolactonase